MRNSVNHCQPAENAQSSGTADGNLLTELVRALARHAAASNHAVLTKQGYLHGDESKSANA